MEEMAEFVEDGLHLTVSKEGGLVSDWLGQVAGDQAEVGPSGVGLAWRETGLQGVHPGSRALRFAWVPVGIERPEVLPAGGIVKVVETDVGMPDLDRAIGIGCSRFVVGALPGGDGNAEEPRTEAEKAVHHPPNRKVGPEILVVEVVALLALLLCPVGDFPWLQGTGIGPGLFRLEGL